jgi:deoxyribodipyrimidine photo-lyase
LQAHLKTFLRPSKNPAAKKTWISPHAILSLDPGIDITSGWKLDRSVEPVTAWRGGSVEAKRLLKEFVLHKLHGYGAQRNKPEIDHTSRMSPYLHFGHISPITVALTVQDADAPKADKETFLNQIVTWRELSVNLVRFNPNYDNFECAAP